MPSKVRWRTMLAIEWRAEPLLAANKENSDLLMIDDPTGRLIADHVECLRLRGDSGRVDIELRDASGKTYVVSLPAATAIELGLLIRGVAERTPFLAGRDTTNSHDR
jgi:hypothetical protein